jgi:two-component system CheB/CheR fusion protein
MPGKKKTRDGAPPNRDQRAIPAAALDKSVSDQFPIIGFGASAGGLEAFTEVLHRLPAGSGLALVLIQHLDPKHSSMLTELLSRETKMRVLQAQEGLIVQPEHLYVIPPNANLSISGKALHIEPRPAGPHMPIDYFFRSLAADQAGRAVGVILSGSASDGTLGLKAIKAEGGITFSQDIGSAKYDGMPRSAIASGWVDFILPPDQIARELIGLAQHPYLSRPSGPDVEVEPDEEGAFQEIFNRLRASSGVDFASYKPGTIRRRILRRMALQKTSSAQDYSRYLRDNQGELQLLFNDILINVTGFFREPATFEAIKTRVLPALLSDRPADSPVRVWVPGCATGEEVYSAAIVLVEYMRSAGTEFPLQIFGTDLSEPALEKARAGIYPETISADVSQGRLKRFFLPINGTYQITRSIRDFCVFARQNVIKDPPFSKLDLILCRNVLIYFGPALQFTVMRLFHYALRPEGYLVLGLSENIGSSGEQLFLSVEKKLKIFSKKQVQTAFAHDVGVYEERRGQEPHRGRIQPLRSPASDLQKKVDQLILSRYSPPAVVIDGDLRIQQFRGKTPFLEHMPGEADLSLAKMAPGALSLEVRKLIHKADLKKTVAMSKLIPVKAGGRAAQVRVLVSPIHTASTPQPLYLVTFEEPAPAPNEKLQRSKASNNRGADQRTRELERELDATRDYLQAVIEEQEASTEELKSAHEEVQSGNEELQSTNEELLTAKEELQSTNEELTTVNEEMQTRNLELQQINNDLLNLLASVTIPIVMLGNDLRIRRFTPQAEKILNLLPTDAGRPISDFRLKINVPDLAALCQEVIDTLASREREVEDAEGRAYAMWIRPYRTSENRIDGVVLALFDITERKRSLEARYQRLFETAKDGIVIADARTGEIVDVNPVVTTSFEFQRRQLLGAKFWESPPFLGAGFNESLLEELHDAESVQKTLQMKTSSGEMVDADVLCNAYSEGERRVIQFNIRDVSARKKQEAQTRRGEEETQKMEAIGRLAGGIAHDFNDSLTAIIGYCDLLGQERSDGEASRELLDKISHAAERATVVTQQLLSFGGRLARQPVTLDLNAVIAEMRQLLDATNRHNVHFEVTLEADECWVVADRVQLEQVILNLVMNAQDAMPNGGRVVLHTETLTLTEPDAKKYPSMTPGEYVVLSVKDAGTGMEAETRSHLFEPFFTTKPRGKGVGLGLSTTYSIVKQSGGYIAVNSELGSGSTFTVYLPRVAAPISRGELFSEAADGHGNETILVVEDEASVRAVTRRVLERRGYHVMEAADGPDALRVSRGFAESIDLLLTDVVMPDMSGREVAFQLARERPGMKVLYVSGHTHDAIVHHGVLNEPGQFLRKPFTQNVLAARVREILDRKP